jgi:transcriptional regulator with XRE-family HTH domain
MGGDVVSTLTVITCTDCGHTTPPTSHARATYAITQHSCATVIERAARAQRRLDRLALSGPEQPCTHGAQHVHGTYVCYVIDRCKCRPCRDANNTYTANLHRRHMYGKASYVDAGPARAHIHELTAAGMGLKRIVAVSTISQGLLWKLMYGKTRPDGTRTPSKRIKPATEQTILAITLDLAGGAKIDSTGTTRRIQALVACGWSMSKLAARLGIGRANFTGLAQGRTGVTVTHAKAVADLYDELWDVAPPHVEWRDHIAYSRALNYSAKAGWVPPLGWDEDTLDDPAALPDVGEQIKVNGRPLKFNIEDVDFILDNDPLTIDQLAARLHVTRNTLEKNLGRNRRDLLDRMIRNTTVQEYAS